MGNITGFTKLALFILKRDRLYVPLWILGLVSLAVFFAPLMPDFFGDEQSAAVLIEMMKNPAMIAMMGLPYGNEIGQLYGLFMLVWSTMAAGIFNILFVIRHTRKDEEQGRSEIIASLAVGRNANLLAVLVTALIANLIIALLTMASISAFSVEGIGPEGAMYFGLALGSGGFVFAAITACIAQLFESSKATTIGAFVILGVAYMMRALGDVEPDYEVLSLLSPLGLIQRVEAWGANEIWPVGVLLLGAIVISLIAFALSSVRDTGAGLIPQKTGRSHASLLLRGEWSFTWRLTRGTFIGWALVMLILGSSYGMLLNDISGFIESNAIYQTILVGPDAKGDVMNGFISSILLMMAIISAVPVCMIIHRVKAEEKRGRLELLLSLPVGRIRLMSGFALIAVVLSVVLLICTPLGIYASGVMTMDEPPALDMMILASLNYLPAVLAVAGLSALLMGIAPKASSVVWVYLTACFLISYIGNLLVASATDEQTKNLIDNVLNTSVFNLTPSWPTEDFNVAIAVGVSIVFVVLALGGLITYRRRDIKC